MFAVIKKDSRIEGKDEERQVIVNRVTVRALADVERGGVEFARATKPGGITRVVTVDGQKLDFNSSGKLVAGGMEEKETPKAAAAEQKDEKKES